MRASALRARLPSGDHAGVFPLAAGGCYHPFMKVTKTPIPARARAAATKKSKAPERAASTALDAGTGAEAIDVVARAIRFEGIAHGTEYQWGGVRLTVLDAGGNIPTFTAMGRQWLLRNSNVSWQDRLEAGNERNLNGDPANVYVKKVDTGGIDEIIRNMKGAVVHGKTLVDHGPLWGVESPSRLEVVDGKPVIVNELIADGMKLRREIHPTAKGALFRYELEALGPKDGGSSEARSAYYAPHIKVPVGPKTRILIEGAPRFHVDPGSVRNIAGVDTDALQVWPRVGDVDLSAPASRKGAYHVKTHIIMPTDKPVAKMTLVEGSRALDITWDRVALPQAGNWFNYGAENFGVEKNGKAAPMCVDAGLEPTNGLCDDPSSPRNKNVPKLKPGEKMRFWYALEARDLNDLGASAD